MNYISIFSGIEAATVAWEPLGWVPIAFSEIEPFCCKLLEKRYPDVPNLGDIKNVDWSSYRGTDLLVGGSPCFVAGTPIITRRGIVPIEEVTTDDSVLTHKGRYRKVLKVGHQQGNTIILKGQGSWGIECTPNHPFYTYDDYDGHISYRWCRADNMLYRHWLHPRSKYDSLEEPNCCLVDDVGWWGEVDEVLPGHENVTVYNLEVREDGSYTADGIAVHNCQSFSVAGDRRGLMDERGQLMYEYIRAVHDIQPKWFVWENVPGVLSQSNGDAFETFQGELEKCGYSLAWRTLDAQFFGVAQRRRRVFLIGHTRVGCAAAVLFERESLRWDSSSSRKKRESLTREAGESLATAIRTANTSSNGWGISEELTHTLDCASPEAIAIYPQDCLTPWDIQSKRVFREDGIAATLGSLNIVPSVLTADTYLQDCLTPWDVQSKKIYNPDGLCSTLCSGTKEGMNIVPSVLLPRKTTDGEQSEVEESQESLAFTQNSRDEVRYINGDGSLAGALTAQQGMKQQTYVLTGTQSHSTLGEEVCSFSQSDEQCKDYEVRRLTPMECERLQGFPDGYTKIDNDTKDTPRYRALGNSMAVPVMRWIGERIQIVDDIVSGKNNES